MSWFGGARKAPVNYNDPLVNDTAWLSEGQGRFSATVSKYYGSPDTIAAGGAERLGQSDSAAALFFFQKAIDTMHSIYVCGFPDNSPASWRRQPSAHDLEIIDGYLQALSVVRELRAGAPISESVQEITHRLRTISSHFQRYALNADAYLDRLDKLARIAPDVDVSRVLWN